jgi:ferredoxin
LSSDDEGYVMIRGGDPIDVPDDLRGLAEEVEGTCPENAISLIEA